MRLMMKSGRGILAFIFPKSHLVHITQTKMAILTGFKADSKWNQALCWPSKTLTSHNGCERLVFSKTRDLSRVGHCAHPLNETKRCIVQPAFRMYGSCLISPDSDWGTRTEFPEGCRAHVRSDILQSDVSGSMLWACSITRCLSVTLPSCSATCTRLPSAGEQWAAPAAQHDESYLCKHAGCLSRGDWKTLNVFFSSRFFIPRLFIIPENRDLWLKNVNAKIKYENKFL